VTLWGKMEVRVRRKQETWSGTARQIVDYVLRGSNDINVVVGPLLWQPSDGVSGAKRWYFIVATSDERGWRCDMVNVEEDEREWMRMRVMAALVERRPLVIHDMGDEVEMARLCEVLWPGPRIAAVRKQVEADYAKRALPR
jgi:hypothetical protein